MKYLKLYEDYHSHKKSKRGEDEVFTFLTLQYDVEKAWDLITKNPEKYTDENGQLSQVSMEETAKWFSKVTKNEDGSSTIKSGVHINTDYAKSITSEQLEEGGIFVVDSKYDFNFMIDGWHRAYVKNERGDEFMNVYVIHDPKDVEYIRITK